MKEIIKNKIKSELIADPTSDHISKEIDFENKEEIKNEEEKNNSIIYYRHSFLSNFYPVNINFEGKNYPSLEHAYQAQKYDEGVFKKLSFEQLDEINSELKNRGHMVYLSDETEVFTNLSFTSGNIKVISTFLDKFGKTKENWDEIKLDIMIELLIKKYEDPDLKQKLLGTGNKYLIEGNTRNNTYRGWSGGNGRNYLGRILMWIRSNNKS